MSNTFVLIEQLFVQLISSRAINLKILTNNQSQTRKKIFQFQLERLIFGKYSSRLSQSIFKNLKIVLK